MHAVVGCKEVVDLNNNSDGLGKVESISNVTLEEEEEFFDAMEAVSNVEEGNDLGLATSEEEEEFFDAVEEQEPLANFNVPLSIFHYKDYNSDFFTSWYSISSRIFKEINQACPEKQALNLALSFLMLPYIVFTALGLAVYNKLKTNDKTQISSGENKTKKSEVSESTAKRLAYGALAAVAILVSIPILLLLLIPATPALAIFYLLNRKLSHSLIDVLKISSGSYQNEHQNIEVSFHEIDAGKSDIKWDMAIKFPPQFEQLLRDLYEDKDGSWFNVARDSEHNTILKLSANIRLKNGLVPLRNEIKNVLATSIQEFAKTMEELMKLEKKDITYDKLKELLNEFRLKVVDSIDPKLTSHLIQNAYQVAFTQAIKFAQKRKGDFSLERALEEVLIKEELKSQGKELPSKKEMIIKDLKSVGIKVRENSKDDEFSVYEADWKQLREEYKIAKRKIIDIYNGVYPKETAEASRKAEEMIKELKEMGEERYEKIREKLKEIYENRKNSGLKDDALKRKLEDLFKFEYNEKVEQKLIESRIRTIQAILSESDNKVKQSLAGDLNGLNEIKTSDKVNEFITKIYLEIKKYKVQRLLKEQKEGVLDLCGTLKRYDELDLAEIIEAFRVQDEGNLEESTLEQTLKDQNERLQAKQNDREKGHPITKSIEVLLKRNEAILETLELEQKELLINEETKNNYREELESREKIKFAIIDELLEVLKQEAFNEKEIKKLFEKAELEYCLAEKCIKGPVIKTKDNIKHFSQNLLSPLIDRLVENIVNNVPKSDKSSWLQPIRAIQTGLGYIKTGLAVAIYRDKSTEGKALDVAHNSYKEGETFLQYFQSSYEEVGGLVGDLFSDEGETFKNDVWPKIKDHLYGIWDRFFKDVEFKIGNKLDEVSVTQQNQKAVITS